MAKKIDSSDLKKMGFSYIKVGIARKYLTKYEEWYDYSAALKKDKLPKAKKELDKKGYKIVAYRGVGLFYGNTVYKIISPAKIGKMGTKN